MQPSQIAGSAPGSGTRGGGASVGPVGACPRSMTGATSSALVRGGSWGPNAKGAAEAGAEPAPIDSAITTSAMVHVQPVRVVASLRRAR